MARPCNFATLKPLIQEKGVPIPRHALLSANRHDGERMASPVPFALRFTPRVAHPYWVVCAPGVIFAGETSLALACLNPAVARKLWWTFRNLVRLPDRVKRMRRTTDSES